MKSSAGSCVTFSCQFVAVTEDWRVEYGAAIR